MLDGVMIVSQFAFFEIALDDLVESEECLLLTMSVNETELDPRDQGQVDLVDSVAIVRIIGKLSIVPTYLC